MIRWQTARFRILARFARSAAWQIVGDCAVAGTRINSGASVAGVIGRHRARRGARAGTSRPRPC